MDNNDLIIRLRYALDIKNTDMVEIFKLGGVEVTKADVMRILIKTESADAENQIKCNNKMFDAFLNGFIIFKRGKQEPKPGMPTPPPAPAPKSPNVNNLLLKKVKIALSLTTEDMLDILDEGGIAVSKGELGALLRKEGHKNYKECKDGFARRFLKGLAIRYRELKD
ncbi:cytoplasmic protein [Lottiidibacillus patelloidae]|uniref:Cytoplasmic protein n=1 Tax=Lottiidibacillus patelloidae TaxID=2670334 RepID=A0A263BT86_9BACI|nr:DUF1456 family protein [Lottiidibacillus patelloidae]OZM56915.1 cytoplasmic protein [Lottiidibacillus patelloidae]